jgi:siroheme synthase (precorrin-2 oxidase/ferrochelatase)
MEQLKKAPYVLIGTGDFAVQKAKDFVGRARQVRLGGPEIAGFYEGLADRGQTVVRQIGRSKPARRAVGGTKQASRQLKGAATSVRKALGFEDGQRKRSTTRKAG